MRFGIRELIFMVVLLAVPLASYVYVFKPRNEEIRTAKQEVEVKQARLNKLREVSSRIDDVELAIRQGELAIQVIENKLPSQQDVEIILEDIWKSAKKNKLAVKSVKNQKQLAAANYKEQPLKVVIEGSFTGFYEFLLDVEKLDRITRVHQLTIMRLSAGRGGSGAPQGAVKAEFMLSIYFVGN